MGPASGDSAAPPLDVAFLGCGFITEVHSRHLRSLRDLWRPSYASRDGAGAVEFRGRFSGKRAYDGYADALADPEVDAVVVAVPPRWHLELTLAALEAGKHVLVEKPAFLQESDYLEVIRARDAAARTVLAGGDAFFEEGVHWLHLAGSLGPRIVRVDPHTPAVAPGPGSADRRGRS